MEDNAKVDKHVYDLCIVGAGLIGSSAARHASATPGYKVCVVGPEEPKDRRGRDIFGAWYDEGRITRSTASDTLWAELASRSIARYRQLEQDTDIQFYSEVGCLTIASENDPYLSNTHQSATAQGLLVADLDARATKIRFPYLGVSSGDASVLESEQAGFLNPRKLLAAQLLAARRQGCDVITDVVSHVTEESQSAGGVMKVRMDSGRALRARKVLLAVGAFSESRDLLPPGVKLDIHHKTQTVLLAEIGDKDSKRLKEMPSILYKSNRFSQGLDQADKYDIYILPPIIYPDGRTYVKLGHGGQFESTCSDSQAVAAWYTNPAPQHVTEGLMNIFSTIFPDLEPLSFHTDTCVTSHTPSKRPYVDNVSFNLGVALGGNGYAAKSCDEVGKIAAHMMLSPESWKYDIPKEKFKMSVKKRAAKL